MIAKLINKFRAENPDLATQNGSADQCYSASMAFTKVLLGTGIQNSTIPSVFVDESYTNHRVVKVDDLLIDWTARQYDPSAPFPLVIREGMAGMVYKNPLYPVLRP